MCTNTNCSPNTFFILALLIALNRQPRCLTGSHVGLWTGPYIYDMPKLWGDCMLPVHAGLCDRGFPARKARGTKGQGPFGHVEWIWQHNNWHLVSSDTGNKSKQVKKPLRCPQDWWHLHADQTVFMAAAAAAFAKTPAVVSTCAINLFSTRVCASSVRRRPHLRPKKRSNLTWIPVDVHTRYRMLMNWGGQRFYY